PLNDSTNLTVVTSPNLQYVELPLTLKLKTNEIGYMTYFLQVGVAPGVNIRSRADVTTTTQIDGKQPTTVKETGIDIKDNINNINLSMVISAGVEYNLSGNTNLLLALTFNNGFLDI